MHNNNNTAAAAPDPKENETAVGAGLSKEWRRKKKKEVDGCVAVRGGIRKHEARVQPRGTLGTSVGPGGGVGARTNEIRISNAGGSKVFLR